MRGARQQTKAFVSLILIVSEIPGNTHFDCLKPVLLYRCTYKRTMLRQRNILSFLCNVHRQTCHLGPSSHLLGKMGHERCNSLSPVKFLLFLTTRCYSLSLRTVFYVIEPNFHSLRHVGHYFLIVAIQIFEVRFLRVEYYFITHH